MYEQTTTVSVLSTVTDTNTVVDDVTATVSVTETDTVSVTATTLVTQTTDVLATVTVSVTQTQTAVATATAPQLNVNLLKNPSFENAAGAVPADWVYQGTNLPNGATAGLSSERVEDGHQAFKFHWNNAIVWGGSWPGVHLSQPVTVTPGATYQVAASWQHTNPNAQCNVVLDVQSTFWVQSVGGQPANVWLHDVHTFTAPSSSLTLMISADCTRVFNQDGSNDIWLDSMSLVRIA